MLDQEVVKLLLNHKFFNKVGQYLEPTMFEDEFSQIYGLIKSAHEKYGTSISVDELKQLYFATYKLTTAQKGALSVLFDKLNRTETPQLAIAEDLIYKLYQRDRQRQIAEVAIRGINSPDDPEPIFNEIQSLLDTRTSGISADKFEFITKEIDTLLESNDPSTRFAFNINGLQDVVGGAGRGNNVIVFGRPEVGKSSLMAFITGGYLRSGLNVVYFANEEPGQKIMLNIVRGLFDKSDLTMRSDVEEFRTEWGELSNNLQLIDAVGLSGDDVAEYTYQERPDVVIVDQTDKLFLKGYGDRASHERLKDLYVYMREICKKGDCLLYNISQASADAAGHRYLTFDMLDMSKTGKPGEADLIIGIGKNDVLEEDNVRYLNISKNKISGRHDQIVCGFTPQTCQFLA